MELVFSKGAWTTTSLGHTVKHRISGQDLYMLALCLWHRIETTAHSQGLTGILSLQKDRKIVTEEYCIGLIDVTRWGSCALSPALSST